RVLFRSTKKKKEKCKIKKDKKLLHPVLAQDNIDNVVSELQFFSIVFTRLANHGSTSSNAHIYSAQQESSLANGLAISHCFHTIFFEFEHTFQNSSQRKIRHLSE